jgi:hypothetical protein
MKFILATVITLASTFAFSHSGDTDRMGCHVDSRTGMRHCH